MLVAPGTNELLFVQYGDGDSHRPGTQLYKTATRKHVMRTKRRVSKVRPRARVVKTTKTTDGQQQRTDASPGDSALLLSQSIARGRHYSNPYRYLGLGIAFPGPLTIRTRQLLNALFDETMDDQRGFRTVWLPILVESGVDMAVLYIVLSTYAVVASKAHGMPELLDEVPYYHSKALRSVQDRVGEAANCNSDSMVAAVLCLAAFNRVVSEIDQWETHLQGLKRILDMRGGIETIRAPSIQMLLFITDTSGSCVKDIRPTFPLPVEILPSLDPLRKSFAPSNDTQKLIEKWRDKWPHRTGVAQMLQDVAMLTEWIANEPNDFFDDSDASRRWIQPLIHRCLLLRPCASATSDSGPEQPGHEVQEAVRHGIILYLIQLRRRFGIITGGTATRLQHLKDALLAVRRKRDWDGLVSLLVWVIALGGMEAEVISDQISFATFLVAHPQLAHLPDDEIVKKLRGFIWMDRMLDIKLERLMSQVASM